MDEGREVDLSNTSGIEAAGLMGHMKKKGSFKIIIFGLLLGVALLVIGGFLLSDEKKNNNDKVEEVSGGISFTEYKESVRREVEEICLRVGGVNSAKAVVFFDGLGTVIYAQNIQSGSVEKNEYVIVGSGTSAHALYLGESLPRLSGIGVVCNTGNDPYLKNELAALLAATYGLPLTRIYISEG